MKVLAEVPDDQRFGLEADITRQLREKYPLLNVLDGSGHTEESRKQLREGLARARASRSAS